MSETRAFLGLGGNIGDPRAAMASALRIIDGSPEARVVSISSLYRTPPWGNTAQPDFLNAAAEIRTSLDARGLLDLCLDAERRLKRVRAERWGPRLIDIDILLFGAQTIKEGGLEIPHPRLAERAFVLVPLVEIAPELRVGGMPIRSLLSAVDVNGIEKITDSGGWWSPTD